MTTVMLFRDFREDQRTSMEVYAENLMAHLLSLVDGDIRLRDYRPILNGKTAAMPNVSKMRMRYARYVFYPRLARGKQGDVNHILDHGYAHLLRVLNPSRTVVTVHDIIPILAGRGLIPGIRRRRRSWLAEWTARHYRNAARIFAISENTKRDLVRYCGCDPARIEVVYYGIGPNFSPIKAYEKRSARERFGLPFDEKLVLITGQQYYKNQETSLRVVEKVRSQFGNVRLVRLGRAAAEWALALRRSSIAREVVHIDFIPSKDMHFLYNAVDCLLFPSWYEGFGLPPLEAMACGTPVVCSNAASLPEAVGDAALTAAPDDVDGLARHVQRVLSDDGFRARQIARGLEHARRFSWRRNAERVIQIYKELANAS